MPGPETGRACSCLEGAFHVALSKPDLHVECMQELRVKGSYVHHKEIRAAQGVKLAGPGLESAVAGTQLLVVGADDDVSLLKEEVMQDMESIFDSVDRSGLRTFPPPPAPSLHSAHLVQICSATHSDMRTGPLRLHSGEPFLRPHTSVICMRVRCR